MEPKFLLYSRWGDQLGELSVLAATHRQEIDSTDQLDLTVTQPLAKGDRVLWTDGRDWYEHVVDEESQSHDGGETFTAVCQSSLMVDLEAAHVSLWVANQVSAQEALSTILQQTTWDVAEVEDMGLQDLQFEIESAYEALCDIAGAFGAEFQPVLTMGEFGVESRRIRLVKQIGSDNGVRFEYGYTMNGVTKEILSDQVITACYGYGATLDSETDGVKDRVKVLVEDNEAKTYWGIPDGRGGAMHVYGVYENSDCDDSTALRDETAADLTKRNRPSVSYTTDMPFASLRGVRLGDTVQVIDRDFTPELRLEARIGALDRDILSGETSSATFGTVTSILPDVLARAYTVSKAASTAAKGVSAASIMAGFNGLYTQGGAYICQTSTAGIVTANVPLNQDGTPSITTGELFAMQVMGGRVRAATSVDSTGRWLWQESVSPSAVTIGGGVLTVSAGELYFNGKKVQTA